MTAMPRPMRAVPVASAPASTGADRRNRSLNTQSWSKPCFGGDGDRRQFLETQVVVHPHGELHGATTAWASISTRETLPIRPPT